MYIPPRRGHDRPCRAPVDEEAASTPHSPPPQAKLQVQYEFQVSLMPQLEFFSPITPKAYQAYMNFWYAQAQAQTQTDQAQYLVPPTITFAQHTTPQHWVKLSKLVKKARQLGCETFSGSVDAVLAKKLAKKSF